MNIAKLLVAGSATVAAVALAGCGNLDNSAAPAPSSSSSPSPAPSGPVPTSESSAPAPNETATPTTSGSTDCKAADLKLSLGRGDSGAGTTHRPLQFTNKSDQTCTIQGFPGVSYVTGDRGQMVGAPAERVGTKGAPIRLAPGKMVSSDIGFTQVANFDPGACKQTAVRGLRVYPPHDTASMFVALDGNGCAGKTPGPQLTVKTVEQ